MTIYACTPPVSPYPPYLNVQRTPEGDFMITQRHKASEIGGVPQMGDVAQIILPRIEMVKLVNAVVEALDADAGVTPPRQRDDHQDGKAWERYLANRGRQPPGFA